MCESLNALEERIGELLKNKKPILIALDGRCAAGKTMLAQKLAKDLSAAVSGGLQESSQDLGTAAVNGGSQESFQGLGTAAASGDSQESFQGSAMAAVHGGLQGSSQGSAMAAVHGGLQSPSQDLSAAAVHGGLQSPSQDLSAAVIHIDDFFLRPFQRTAERLSEPGGNFDRERFLKEVLLPLRSGEQPLFRPYNCHTDSFLEEIKVPEKKIYIIEGSYSCHPALKEFYDLSIFVTTTPKKQLERLEKRNKDLLQDFINKWIPYEEKYFKAFDISDGCDFVFET